MTDALSRLTTPPPDEIAGLIERLRRKFIFFRDPDNSARWIVNERHLDEDCIAAAAALPALAQENERLTEVQKSCHRDIIRQDERIRELEDERDKFLDSDEVGRLIHDHVISACRAKEAELSRQRDAIRRKTIEECAKVVISWQGEFDPLVDAIRALAHSERGEG